MTDETVIRLSEVKMEGVGKRYGDHWVVKDVSLSIRPGEFYTLLGPSGCGKTTLLRMLAGFAQPDAGRILVDDEPIDLVPPWKRNVGMVFQNYALWPHMSVFENVAFGLRERGVAGHELERNIPPLVNSIEPAVKRAQKSGAKEEKEIVTKAVEENVWQSVENLFMSSPKTRELVANGKVKVLGAIYDVGTGKVAWLPETKPAEILKAVESNPKKAVDAPTSSHKH